MLNKLISDIKDCYRLTKIRRSKYIVLYAGDIPIHNCHYSANIVGLSLHQNENRHIKHNILNKHPFKDNSIDIYQSEDVFEHIEYNKLEDIVRDIYRILKPNGLFRLSTPDYRCDVLYTRSIKDGNGNIIFDEGGGGIYSEHYKKVINGGHVWFPKYEDVKYLLEKIPFQKIDFLHYYGENNKPHCSKIDYSKGYIQRTPDHDNRVKNPYRPMSIVVDCYK